MPEPSVNEQLAVLTALQNIVKERLNEVRAQADEDLLAAYDEDGVTKKALKVGGIKVGDYMVMLTKDEWAVTDAEAFNDFALMYGFATCERGIKPERLFEAYEVLYREAPEVLSDTVRLSADWQKLITNTAGTPTYLDSGMAVPGLAYVGPHVKCTQVRGCKPEAVIPVLQQLGGIDRLLLGAPGNQTDIS